MEGVPFKVDEPTQSSPGIWPTKEELKGAQDQWEALSPPVGNYDYDSAETFSETIKETFQEEKVMDLVEGPFTKQRGCNVVVADHQSFALGLWQPLMRGTR